MANLLLWIEHLAFVALLYAALLAWIARAEPPRRTQRLVFAAALLLLPHAGLVVVALVLRFDYGFQHAPWLYVASLFVALLAGVLALARRALAGDPPRARRWPAGMLTLAAGLALLLDLMTCRNLDLAVRQRVSALGTDAGLLAYSVLPGRPLERENAAPRIARVIEEWIAAEEDMLPERLEQLDSYESADLDPLDPELVAWLERIEPRLDELRAAAALPRFRREPEGEPQWLLPPRFGSELLDAGRALAWHARSRAARGELDAAWVDLRALERLAGHQLEQPSLIGTMVAARLRSEAVRAAAQALASPSLDAELLAGFPLALEPWGADALRRALVMEEAFGLATMSRIASTPATQSGLSGEGFSLWSLAGLEGLLYRVFMLEGDVAGYRTTLAEMRALVDASPEELASPVDGASIRARGLFATILVPDARNMAIDLRRAEAELALLRGAVAAARHRARTGSWPRALDELTPEERAALPEEVELASGADGPVLTWRGFPAEAGEPIELRVAP